jgi:tripartite-type tricarboxylate transporter receptor subunit TctC
LERIQVLNRTEQQREEPRMITRRALMTASAASLLAPALVRRACAQASWPTRPVRLVVPYPAGGGADAIARIVSGRLNEVWGQQIVIENRGGAGGNIASEAVARSAPDGYTLYLAGEFLSTNPYLYPKLSYDPVADLTPVSLVVQYPVAMVVPNNSPAQSVKEFIDLAKARPGQLTFASPGHGTGPHLAGEMFKRVAGLALTHVPYRGAAPALQDVVGGRVDSFFNNIAGVVPLMREGQLRVLAITTARRTPAEPQIPTLAEAALPGFDVSGWYALFVPANTPPDIIRRVHADTAAVLAEPNVRGRLEQLGLLVVGSSPDELGAHLKSEMTKWAPLIREAGLKLGE